MTYNGWYTIKPQQTKPNLEKGMNPLIPQSYALIVSLPSLYKDCFGINKPTKVDMLLKTKIGN